MELALELTQRGQLPADAVARAIVEAHVRAGATAAAELAKAVSGGVVQRLSGTPPGGRPHLAEAIVSETTRLQKGEIRTLVGFDKRVAFIGRFLERGTSEHQIKPKRRRRSRHQTTAGPARKRALAFMVGGQLVMRASVQHKATRPFPIFGETFSHIEPVIRADFARTVERALNG